MKSFRVVRILLILSNIRTNLRKTCTNLKSKVLRESKIKLGIFALCYEELCTLADLKIYITLDDSTALERRILRDTAKH